jgi:pyrroline-5-carboxylate reductase
LRSSVLWGTLAITVKIEAKGVEMNTTGIIGAGNMGRAIGEGLRSIASSAGCAFYDVDGKKAEEAARACGGKSFQDLEGLFKNTETLLIAVKPQHLDALWQKLPQGYQEKKYISIVAGKPISYLREHLHTDRIIRFMPNLAAKVGAAVVAVSFSTGAEEDFKREALKIAAAVGEPVEMPEHLLSAFTGLSGSGIAYVFAFLHALALGGTDAGIPYDQALKIACGTVDGAVKVLRNDGISPSEYLTRVTSAGGTTIRGVKALEAGRFTHTVMEAVRAAAEKAVSMERE